MITQSFDQLELHVVLEPHVMGLQVHALVVVHTSMELDPDLATLDLAVRLFLIVKAVAAKIGT